MDPRSSIAKPDALRRESPNNSSLDSLRAFTGPPLRPAQSLPMMQNPHVRTGSHPIADVKPRLTKEQHDILETHFQQQQKPTTNTKKGFAETLGVPLDKINNWFQNRRAKVKQDAKKALNSRMLYEANLQSYTLQQQQQSQHQNQQNQQTQSSIPIPTASSYFPSNSSVSPVSRPADSTPSGLEGLTAQALNAQFSLQPDFSTQGLSSISESAQPGSYTSVIQSMIAAGYPMDALTAMTQSNNQFDSFETASYDSNASGSNGQFLSSLTIPTSNFASEFDFSAFTPGSSHLPPDTGLTSASSDPNSFAGAQFTPATQSCSSAHATGSVTSLPLYDDDSDAQDDMFTPGFNFQHGVPQHRHAASSSQISLPIFGGQTFNNSSFYQQSNHSSQVIISPPDQYDTGIAAFCDLEPPNPPFAQDAFSRRSSSTSNLADTMQTVGIDSRASSTSESGGYKQPASSIAARRHRRPAPLGSGATRSASYTPGMPGSPSSQNSQDQTLRRIRSSQGMNGGRVQKNSGSAQHSPVTFAFNAAAGSPKFARQAQGIASAASTPGVHGGPGNIIPPTPMTPNETATRFPSWQTSGEIKPQPSFNDTNSPPDSLGIASSSDPRDMKSASPQTPAETLRQAQVGLNSNTVYRDTPPQSAPPTQQSFSQAVYMGQQPNVGEYLAPNEYALGHMRRPSLPEGAGNAALDNHMHPTNASNFGANELQMNFPMQYPSALQSGYINQGMPMYSMEQGLTRPSASAAMHAASNASDFLVVHEYAPPGTAGQKIEPRRQPEQPKTFVFANQGPTDFQQS